ncbi:MAG: hypothetical protein ACYSSO_02705 [Planctomycetota bacterium]|jgi:hypothetical protein
MTRKKISQKIQQAAEKYLASHGSSREQLTDKQWEVFANYVKSRRMVVLFVTLSLAISIFNAYLSLLAFQLGNQGVSSMIPSEAERVIFISKAGEEISSSVPSLLKLNAKYAGLAYWLSGLFLITAIFFFLQLLSYILLDRRNMKKTIDAFIS